MRRLEGWVAAIRGRRAIGVRRALGWVVGLKLEALIVCLVALTGAAAYYQDEILARTLVYSNVNRTAYNQYVYADAGSRADMDATHPLVWTCSLGEDANPYCGYGVQFDIRNDGSGLGLARFHSVEVTISYRGPADSLRIDLKNRDPGFDRFGAGAVDKINTREFAIVEGRQTIELPLEEFSVAAWWIQQNGVPPELAGVQFDNVVALEIQTSNGASPGAHRLQIQNISFRGTLLSTEQYYAAISGAWLIVIALILAWQRQQARRREESEAVRWRKTLDTIPQMVWSVAPGSDEYYNGQWSEFAGECGEEEAGPRRLELIHPDDRPIVARRWENSLDTGVPFETEYRMRDRSGEYRYVLARGLPEQDAGGAVTRWYGTCTDIHERVMAQRELWRSQSFNRQLIEATPDGIVVVDQSGFIIFANEAARPILDAPLGLDLAGKSWISMVPSDVRRVALDSITLGDEAPRHFTAQRSAQEGGSSWWDVMVTPLASGHLQTERFLVISRDISHQKLAEEQARWSSRHDPLTGLPNRVMLQHEVDALASMQGGFAVLILDLDEFKKINDTLGHDAGDALLCTFAERLKEAARPDDLVSRLGGDEFAVVLNGVEHEGEIQAVCDRIFAALRDPCVYQGKIIDCNTSIGASLFPRDGDSRTELLKNADVALYVAKSSGRRKLKIFNADMRVDVERRHGMISRAQRALQEDSILPFYQPKVELGSGRIAGFEALLRWRHPEQGIQTPDTISAAFEDLALAAEISDRIIDHLIVDVRDWLDRGFDFQHVAFNAAAAELRAGDFADRLLEKLEKASIPPSAIQMEVTETVFLGRGAEYVHRTLDMLSTAGIRIALDDFGTGYASLTHLKEFPVHLLKIDKSFIRNLGLGNEDGAIVDAVIGLGRSLQIDVIAEGIETVAQRDTLIALGCEYGQGFLYSRPIPASKVGRACSPHGLVHIAAAA